MRYRRRKKYRLKIDLADKSYIFFYCDDDGNDNDVIVWLLILIVSGWVRMWARHVRQTGRRRKRPYFNGILMPTINNDNNIIRHRPYPLLFEKNKIGI